MYTKLKRLTRFAALLTISISCRGPQFQPVERCVIDIANESCWCHQYDLNTLKRISDTIQEPITHCDKGVVFQSEAWATEIRPTAIEIKSFWEDQCKP